MDDRLIMARLSHRSEAGRDFDIEFWQKLGDAKIFAAAWDLVVTAAAMRGIPRMNSDLRDLLRLFEEYGVRFLSSRRVRRNEIH
jgi:hypothetical protein